MKKTILFTLIAALLISTLAIAETDIDVSGEVRARSELSDRTFIPDSLKQMTTLLRSRVNIKATKDHNTTAFVQLQDSRILGDRTYIGDWASGTLNDGKNVDIHQAYIEIDRIWWDGLGGKVGRFEVNFGNQRVFGSVGWSNVGRSWEGGMNWYSNDKMKLTGFMLKRQEMNRTDGNADFDVYGLYYENKKLHMDLFGVYEYDANAVDTASDGDNIAGVKRWSFGTYYNGKSGSMDYTLNAVYQTGKVGEARPGPLVGTEMDVAAYLFTFEAGYSFENKTDARIAVGIDYSSGDDEADDEIKSYSGLYPTAHKFQGYMDYFTTPMTAGLMDIYLKGECNFTDKWWGMLDWHYFKTSADYMGMTEMTTDVGMEFDLTVKTTSIDGLGLVWGVSYFIPKDEFVGYEENDPGFWSYCQGTVSF